MHTLKADVYSSVPGKHCKSGWPKIYKRISHPILRAQGKGFTGRCQEPHNALGHNQECLLERRSALLAAFANLSFVSQAFAIGPTDVVLDNVEYTDVSCSQGTPKDARCIQVTATGELKGNKPAFNGEIFGRVRYANGESAIYGDYAEASDAGKIGDIDEIPNGKTELKFNLLLQPGRTDETLNFIKLKIRAYPGMSKNFRIMKPVAETLDTCDPDYDICD